MDKSLKKILIIAFSISALAFFIPKLFGIILIAVGTAMLVDTFLTRKFIGTDRLPGISDICKKKIITGAVVSVILGFFFINDYKALFYLTWILHIVPWLMIYFVLKPEGNNENGTWQKKMMFMSANAMLILAGLDVLALLVRDFLSANDMWWYSSAPFRGFVSNWSMIFFAVGFFYQEKMPDLTVIKEALQKLDRIKTELMDMAGSKSNKETNTKPETDRTAWGQKLKTAFEKHDNGHYETAIVLYDDLIGTAPEDLLHLAYFGKATTLVSIKRYNEAIVLLEKSAALGNPDAPRSLEMVRSLTTM